MANQNRTISITEYGRIYTGERYDEVLITKRDIEELKAYIDGQNSDEKNGQATYSDFLKPIRNGVQANNYVGVLQTNSGLTIEILPKIYGKTSQMNDKEVIRKLFLKMLKAVRVIDGKSFKMTNLNIGRNNLFEVFISMFLNESSEIIKRGLKANYVAVQGNERFLKGKLLMGQHLRKNSINQSYFFNEYDEFLIDAPENQLLKATLQFLLRRSKDNHNLRLLREQLVHFDAVDSINDAVQTFSKVQLGRNNGYYKQALDWCHIFLMGKSFTSFHGSSLAFAILFPMETIFEAYIASLAKQYLPNYEVSAQDKSYWLFDKTAETKKGYCLRPDIVVRSHEGQTIIADTKWKVLDNKGPSQGDLYQMYAYFTRYKDNNESVDKVILIYPYSEWYTEQEFRSLKKLSHELGVKIQVRFVDLLTNDIENQIINLFELEEYVV